MSAKPVFTLGVIVRVVFFVVVIPLLPVLVSGQWGWWQAWAYALVYIGGFVASRVAIARKNPDLIAVHRPAGRQSVGPGAGTAAGAGRQRRASGGGL